MNGPKRRPVGRPAVEVTADELRHWRHLYVDQYLSLSAIESLYGGRFSRYVIRRRLMEMNVHMRRRTLKTVATIGKRH